MALKNIFKAFLLFASITFSAGIKAQDTCVYLYTIPQNANFATTDQLANTYLLHGFEVEKYDSTGRFAARFSNNRLGMPAFVDASNPLKILVWYADFQTAVFLDRNMTELGRLNVSEAGWPSVSTLAMATDGNLWLYDLLSFKLLKITSSGVKLVESESLSFGSRDLEADAGRPVTIKENGDRVFLGFEGLGIYAFNIFGQNPDLVEFSKSFKQFEITGNLLTTYLPSQTRVLFGAMGNRYQEGSGFVAPFLQNQIFWFSQRRILVATNSGIALYRY